MSTILMPKKTKTLVCGSETVNYTSFTRWIPAISIRDPKTLLTLVDPTTDFKVTAGFQTATTDPKTPDDWTAMGSYLGQEGSNCSGRVDLFNALGSKFWVRFGAGTRNKATTGTGMNRGQVSLTVSGVS